MALKALIVSGTRPEAIKLAPMIREPRKHPDWVVCTGYVTAQHRQVCFDRLRAGDLNVMGDNQSSIPMSSSSYNK